VTKGSVLILGATSDIARAVARRFASAGYSLQLAGRDPERLSGDKADLELRHHVQIEVFSFDAIAVDDHKAFVGSLRDLPAIAICLVGVMGVQEDSERDIEAAVGVMRANYEGPASILTELANAFEARGSGVLVGVSSVAGERGRAKNYVYGSAKAGFTAFLSGLRNRLSKKGVHVVTVLPGFVRTRMTEGMDLPGLLTAEPDEVAHAILRSVERKKDIVYVRPVWRLVMAIIRNIPERIFKGMNI
jgi:short-subunit dehydrogenase